MMFRKRFGPDVLKSIDGEELIETIFNVMNHDGLAYWLEFKNDEMMDTRHYGSIAGGSSLKYIMYKRKSDNNWMTGSPQKQVILSLDQAIEKGRKIRDAIVRGAEVISKFENPDLVDYMALQQSLDSDEDIKIGGYGWIHKYYHMLFPNLIDAFHTTGWQKHSLLCYGQKPESEQLYVLTGQLMKIIGEINKPTSHVMRAMVRMYGSPVSYYRIGTRGKTSMWPLMLDNSYISIGWPELGNLTQYGTEDNELRNFLKNAIEHYHPNPPQTVSREANEIIRFLKTIKENDIVVAGDGKKTLGIGRVAGGYEYHEGLEFPHVRAVEWIYIGDTHLPEDKEGLQTTVYPFKNTDNILKIRELLSKGVTEPKKEAISTSVEKLLLPLEGVMKKIESILERKKQIILYGPPGTGKTYHAEKTAQELAARSVFKKSWKALTPEEKSVILGDSQMSGYVRICCFHASYGYEDFIEGIKPRAESGQTLFELRDGIFKKLCSDAILAPEKSFFLIIDEINRGDISRIFGELIMLIESGKRGKELYLPVSGLSFSVPGNVYIVGTMNTADRSIALLDTALRRRFGFYELMPDYSLLEGVNFDALPIAEWLKRLNQRICQHIGKDARNLQIGHSYFLENEKPITSQIRFRQIIAEDILPLVEEYCYGDYERMLTILDSDFVDIKNQSLQYSLCEGEFNELVNALLKPCPEIRLSEEQDDKNDVEINDINQSEEEEQ
ncbi:AAA family ATPase [Dehalobacter sp. DCM]|uniref:AAA family ATPase n=1 Tax=Dehalobacter sp. DCM TaxID=2907827 RepID=UPI003081E25A|nr:AAA family ATPase [Dehalobacter sp. DCM]